MYSVPTFLESGLYTVMLNGYSQWLNIREKNKFTLIVFISVMLAFNHKNMPLKKYKKYTVFMLFVHCTFVDWMWNYCNIKVYLKTVMLGGINRD